MLKLEVLIIEDEQTISEQIKTQLGESEYRFRSSGFIEYDELEDINPDIVILDLMQGLPADADYPGKTLHDAIWNRHLFPTIVYSANLLGAMGLRREHLFLKYVQKGKTGLDELASHVAECAKQVRLVKEVKKYVNKECSDVLRFTAPPVISDNALQNDMKNELLKRMTRRRLAAAMDLPIKDEKKILPWEQYIYPPIGSDLKMGDILKKTKDKVEKYVLVLTPSCDLVTSDGRKIKVENLLVAKCKIINRALLSECSIKSDDKDQITNKLLKENKDDTKKYIPLPAIQGCGFRNMVACLKELELIPINEVMGDHKKYDRILSVDSPFRESIAWAYMQDACRPGLPDRNFDRWSGEIKDECTKS